MTPAGPSARFAFLPLYPLSIAKRPPLHYNRLIPTTINFTREIVRYEIHDQRGNPRGIHRFF